MIRFNILTTNKVAYNVVVYPTDLNTSTIRLERHDVSTDERVICQTFSISALCDLDIAKGPVTEYEEATNTLFVENDKLIEQTYISRDQAVIACYDLITQHLHNIVELKTAHINCIRGHVHKIKITKAFEYTNDDGTITPGLYSCFVDYYEYVGDEKEIINSIDLIPLMFFPEETMFYDTIKTLIGGNHQYTSEIEVELEGFSLESIRTEFQQFLNEQKVRAGVEINTNEE